MTYDKDTGNIYDANGKLATRLNARGYYYVVVGGVSVLAHRWAWAEVNGPIPDGMLIDHINRNRTDNRLCNLRLCSVSQNAANANMRKNNTSGSRGVSKRGKRWQAYITTNGKRRHLGYYDTQREAADVYSLVASEEWKEFYNGHKAPPGTVVRTKQTRGRPKKN